MAALTGTTDRTRNALMITAPAHAAESEVFDLASICVAEPYSMYQRFRELAPFVRFPLGDVPVHLVTRYQECAAILLSPDWGHGYTAGISPFRETVALIPGVFLRLDPPEHDRLKAVVNKAFTPRAIAGYGATIDELVDGLLARAVAAGEFDALADLASPLASALITGRLLGAPPEDGPMLREWEFALARGTDPDCLLSADEIARRSQAGRDATAYFAAHAARRRGLPPENLLDYLLAAHGRDALSMPEVIGIALLTLIAGLETSINLIGNCLLALLRNPAQLALLRERPELIPAMVDEVLRWDPPAPFTMRVAMRETAVSGHQFDRGDAVVIMSASAGRDEAVFPAAGQFDITRYHGPRPAKRHLAFGLGLHYCIGAPLARLEAHAAIGALVHRTRKLELVPGPLAYQPTLIHRGLVTLPVRVEA
jgi:cytochrome P450